MPSKYLNNYTAPMDEIVFFVIIKQYPLKVDPFSKKYNYGIHPESNTLNLSHEMDDVENG